jgi:RNA polymerase sigma-70 factor (ECF subfamily)
MADTTIQLPGRPAPSPLEQGLIEHRERIVGYLLVLGAGQAQAEEAIQELAVDLARARDERPDSVIAWLLTAARRTFIDLLRRNAVRHRRELPIGELTEAIEAALGESDDEDGGASDEAEVEALRRCLKRLAPRARRLVELRYWDGLPSAEIAERLAWSDASVRVALHKARRALEACVRHATHRPPGSTDEH